jgi:hypothetical protein
MYLFRRADSTTLITPCPTGEILLLSVGVRKDPKTPVKDTTLNLSPIHPQHKSESVLSFGGTQEVCGRAILHIQIHGSQHMYRLTFLPNAIVPQLPRSPSKGACKRSQHFDNKELDSKQALQAHYFAKLRG